MVNQPILGSNNAAKYIYLKFLPSLRNYLRKILPPDQIDDVIHSTIIKVTTRLHQIRDTKFFKTWVYKIAKNEAYMYLRRLKKCVPLDENSLIFMNDELNKITLKNLELKNHNELKLFCLGYSISEIASILNTNASTVKSRIFRSRDFFRSKLR